MGITSLSMAARAVRPVGAQLGKVTLETCEAAAEAALSAPDPMAGRAAVRAVLGH
jgi:phosphotransferase system enzyme I (PtsI)